MFYLYNPRRNVTYYNHRDEGWGWEPVLFVGECPAWYFPTKAAANAVRNRLGSAFEVRSGLRVLRGEGGE